MHNSQPSSNCTIHCFDNTLSEPIVVQHMHTMHNYTCIVWPNHYLTVSLNQLIMFEGVHTIWNSSGFALRFQIVWRPPNIV